jgi:hypothetical protein
MLAGCSFTASPPTFTVRNRRTSTARVTLTFTQQEDNVTTFEQTFTVPAGTDEEFVDPFGASGTYDIRVRVNEEYDERYEWFVPPDGGRSLTLLIDPQGLGLTDGPIRQAPSADQRSE